MRELKSGLILVAVVLTCVYIVQSFGQSSSITKDATNKPITTEYQKWATIDLQPAIGYQNGAPVRVRVDKINSISAFASDNSDKTDTAHPYIYYTQVVVDQQGIWYDKRPYDVMGNLLLGYGWGSGAPVPYTK